MTCIIDDCDKPVFSKGRRMCGMHYYREIRNGSPHRLISKERAKDWQERFWSKAIDTGSCWEWHSAIDSYGYAVFQLAYPKRQTVKAHRLAYELLIADIPDGLTIDHLCQNRKCINPWHMDPVPASVNGRRVHDRSAV